MTRIEACIKKKTASARRLGMIECGFLVQLEREQYAQEVVRTGLHGFPKESISQNEYSGNFLLKGTKQWK